MDLREGRPQHEQDRLIARRWLLAAIVVLAALLRLPALGSNPPGLYCDEAAIAYDAWLVGKTGADHHGDHLPLYFRSFGEWKNPVYVYADVPVVAALGMTPLAARLPAALFGIATVLVAILFLERLVGTPAALLAGLSLAASPWHVTLSRSAFEATAFPLFLLLGLLLGSDPFIFGRESWEGGGGVGETGARGGEGRRWVFTVLAGVAFGVSWYCYAIARVVVPLAWIAFAVCFRGRIAWPRALATIAIALALWTPGILFAQRVPDSDSRVRLVGVHTLRMWRGSFAERAAKKAPEPIRQLILASDHSRRAFALAANYQAHFSPQYLLLRGDTNGRHGIRRFGLLLHAEALFLVAGLGALWWRRREPSIRFLAALLLIAPVPAALTLDGIPHSIRMLGGLAPLHGVVGLGAWTLLERARLLAGRRVLVGIVSFAWLASAGGFVRAYFVDYRKRGGVYWQQGSEELVRALAAYERPICRIRSREFENLHVFWGFWREAPPEEVRRILALSQEACRGPGERLAVVRAEDAARGTILGTARNGEGRPLWHLVELPPVSAPAPAR